jgi:hypothetical protein
MKSLEIIETEAKLAELDAAMKYLNSDYYWKRRTELSQLIVLLTKGAETIEEFMENDLDQKYGLL